MTLNLEALLSGQHIDVYDFDVNEDYLSHRYVTIGNFVTYMDVLQETLSQAKLNTAKDIRLRDSLIRRVAKRLIQVRPSWEPDIQNEIKEFLKRAPTTTTTTTTSSSLQQKKK